MRIQIVGALVTNYFNLFGYFEREGGLQVCKKATLAKIVDISRVSFKRKTVGSSTTNISAFFEQRIGEIRGRVGRE